MSTKTSKKEENGISDLKKPRMSDLKYEEKINIRWGWEFVERTRILSGIQFTTHFIDSFVVETKQFVSSTVNVILTQQTCGQRSSRAAESKRRVLGNYFLYICSICSSNVKM